MDPSSNLKILVHFCAHLLPIFLLHRSSVETDLRYTIASKNILVGNSKMLKYKYSKNTPLLNLIKFGNNSLASNMSVYRFPEFFFFSLFVGIRNQTQSTHCIWLMCLFNLLIYRFPFLLFFFPLVIYLLKKPGNL